MKNGLNFYLSSTLAILSFVSFLGAPNQASAQQDEFDLFEAELAPRRPASKSAPAVKDTEAQTAFDKGDYAKVTTLLWKKIETLSRGDLVLLAKAHEKKKEASEMIRALNILIGKNDKDAEAYYLMGNAHILQKKNKEALDSYNTALEINARYEAAYLAIADMYEKRTPPNLYEMRTIYQDMVEKMGARSSYLNKLCEINTLDETYEAAVTACKSAIGKDSSVASNYVYLGLAYKHIGDADLAASILKKAADRFPKSELAQYHFGRILEDKKSYVDAVKYYKVGTEADAKSARSWLGLANTSFEIKKYDVSLEAYKKACRFENKNAAAFRKATTVLRNAKNSEWTPRFESAAEICTF